MARTRRCWRRASLVDEIPACFGLHHHFDKVDEQVHEGCKLICQSCPVLDKCAALRDRYLERGIYIEGTWAGQLVGYREPTVRASCGQPHGAQMHRNAREFPCDACWAARRDYERARARRRRQVVA